jgi:hypothetical protein
MTTEDRLMLIRIMLSELPPDERERAVSDLQEWSAFLISVENRPLLKIEKPEQE